MEFFASYINCDEADDVVESGTNLRDFSRRGHRYRKKPFRPELEDIHEGEESEAFVSSSDVDSDDDLVDFKGAKSDTEKPPESSLRSSLLGIDFWYGLPIQNIPTDLQDFWTFYHISIFSDLSKMQQRCH